MAEAAALPISAMLGDDDRAVDKLFRYLVIQTNYSGN